MTGQQRLSRVQLVNWGTFHGAHSFTMPREGLLLTGPSGSGKSSLLDALAAILVRPSRLRFNAAAQGTDTGDRDRSLVTYVRGAYKRQADAETGEIQTAYLRKDATWSGIALTFDDGRGTVTTLIRLFHLARGSADTGDLKSVFILAKDAVEVLDLKPYVENGLEIPRIKRARPDLAVFSKDAYTGFAARFRARLGITSEQAQVLLHKTQSAKNLTSLDSLFREFMLDEPDSFRLADETVEQFTELSAAHRAVVDARKQVEALRPLRAVDQELTRIGAESAEVSLLELHLDAWVWGHQLARAARERDRAQRSVAELAGELAAAQTARQTADRQALEAQRAYDGAGGAQFGALHDLRERYLSDAEQRRGHVSRLTHLAEAEDLTLPTNASGIAAFTERVGELDAELAGQQQRLKADQWQAHARRSQLDQQQSELGQELAALRKHRSNLDRRLLAVRAQLADRLQVAETGLPFVGELLEVPAEQDAWRGAIERVLGSFARTLVVPDRHYLAAAQIIDASDLGTRLVYERVTDGRTAHAEPPTDRRTLVHKLEVADGPFHGWLWDRLCSRFDYACVDHPDDFAGVARAVTRRGQVKHNEHRHEKDDRSRVDDRSRWVLGFSTEAKEADLERRLTGSLVELAAAVAVLDGQAEQDENLKQRRAGLAELRSIGWPELDVGEAERRVAELDQQIESLRRDRPDFATLETNLHRARDDVRAAERIWQELAVKHAQAETKLAAVVERIEQLDQKLAAVDAVPEPVSDALQVLAAELALAEPDEPGLRKELGTRRSRLEGERHRRENEASRVMGRYRLNWPIAVADLGDDVGYLPEYLQRLTGLEDDGLPGYENRFFELLQRQARNNISQLAQVIKGARREVRMRVDEVNKSLLMTEFARGSYLQIEVRDRALPAVEEFLATLGEITSGSFDDAFAGTDDRAAAERRFEAMRRLLEKLSSEDPADKKWRQLCLDTRQHVQFQARVQDADGVALDHYTGSGGRSGGERQRLVTFCLAAALRFQLAPPGQLVPSYALVVIDEAFDKADHEFTRAGLEVFRQFGFQLLLATPLKMLQTIEDYVGGLVMVSNESGDSSRLHLLLFEDSGDAAHQQPSADEALDFDVLGLRQESLL